MKILTIVGCRPQFIKAAAFSRNLRNSKFKNKIQEIILHTGQHYDESMSNTFFSELSIPKPKYNLEIGGGSHGENTGRMIEKIEKVLFDELPNLVLLYGDTDSTLAGAISTSKLSIPIAHVEAGLRSFRKSQPEEQNRILTDHLSEICFTPSKIATNNLKKEGISSEMVIETGDIMQDNNVYFSIKASKNKSFISKNNLINDSYVLVTLHRKENLEDSERLKQILIFLNNLDYRVIFPLHPATRKKICEYKLEKYLENLNILKPCGFIDFATLEKNSTLIITDSGGVQKEAYFYSKPCLTLREDTEWPEIVLSGWNKLVENFNHKELLKIFNIQINFDRDTPKENYYGIGNSAEKIISHIVKKFLN